MRFFISIILEEDVHMRYFVLFILICSAVTFHQPIFAQLTITEQARADLAKLNFTQDEGAKLQAIYAWHTLDNQQDEQITNAKATYAEHVRRIRDAISDIHHDEITKASNAYSNVKAKYQKLLDTYKALSQTYRSLQGTKKSTLKKSIKQQLDSMRPAVYLARDDISRFYKTMQKEKHIRIQLVSKFRKKWASLQVKHTKINTTRAKVTMMQHALQAEWKTLIKQKDHSIAVASLNECEQWTKQIQRLKTSILDQESAIVDAINSLIKQM
jgi:hypothetical protein